MRRRQHSTGRTPAQAALAAFMLTALLPSGGALAQEEDESDPYANLPTTMTLTGVVRDFKDRSRPGGHDDFEREPTGGFGHYQGIVADQLDADGKPVFNSTGTKVSREWKDARGRNIMAPREYLAGMPGDVAGAISSSRTGAATTAANLNQWFRDTPNVNISAPLAITLEREEGSPLYVFDDKQSDDYPDGFFPIDGELFGNSGESASGQSHNFHFTYELSMNFVYKSDMEQTFTFIGDDDVWVFIDNALVIDLGGVHAAERQTIDLHRCDWLIHNEAYTLRFFFAERHTSASNFRIETTLSLLPAELPTVSALFD